MQHALGHFLRQARRDERARALEEQIVGRRAVGPALFADLIDAAEAGRHQQPGPRAVFLENRVGADGRAVREVDDLTAARAAAVEVTAQTADDPIGLGAAGRGHLEDVECAALLIQDDKIGERTARIDGNAKTTTHLPSVARRPRGIDNAR